MSTRWGGFIEGIDLFDASFFGISAREAARMDPQQRLFLEVAWEALEDAGIAPTTLASSDTGVFVGASTHDYSLLFGDALELIDADYGTGNAPGVIANRLSYVLDLHGPSVTFDTACSSSLVALQAACRALDRGDSRVAIVGGVNAVLAPEPACSSPKLARLPPMGAAKRSTHEPTASCAAKVAEGWCSSGFRTRLADGDRIYATIAAACVNHDGASNGMMAPSPRGAGAPATAGVGGSRDATRTTSTTSRRTASVPSSPTSSSFARSARRSRAALTQGHAAWAP